MTGRQIQINQTSTCTQRHCCTAACIGRTVGSIKNISWIITRIHTHGFSYCNQSCFGLENYNLRNLLSDIDANCADKTAFCIHQHFIHNDLIHNLGAGFFGFLGQARLLIRAVIFQMIFSAAGHRVTFKIPGSGRPHLNSIGLPFLNHVIRTFQHDPKQIRILIGTDQRIHDFFHNFFKIRTMIFRYIAQEMVIPAAAISGAFRVCFLQYQGIHTGFCCSNSCLQTTNTTTDY